MNYTTNYHLPQWDETDRIMRTDFNQMCADMEAGLNANANAAEKAAELPYVVGTYIGDGAASRSIDLGFRPRFVIICDDQRAARDTAAAMVLMAGPIQSSGRLFMTDTGFRVDASASYNTYPRVNAEGRTYDYIAFR